MKVSCHVLYSIYTVEGEVGVEGTSFFYLCEVSIAWLTKHVGNFERCSVFSK